MKSNRVRLQVEELGDRILPSSAIISEPPVPLLPPVHVAGAHHHHALSGHGQGTYVIERGIPDTGTTYDLTGTAHLSRLGDVKVSGSLHSTGFILQGHADGSLTFTNAQGTVTIELLGPVQKGFAPLPQKFQYQVVSGTGAYEHLHAHGSLEIVLTPAANNAGTPGGTFVLKI